MTGIKVKMKGESRAQWLTPTGGLTTKLIHAARFEDRARAAALAAEVLRDNGAVVEWTKIAAL